MDNIRIYDNGGKTADRYTAVFMDRNYNSALYGSKLKEALSFDNQPFYALGIGQHTSAMPGRHLGKRIEFSALNADCQRFITDNLEDETTKTPGQIAYEQDVINQPVYHDGTPRKTWDKLCDVAKWSWERNPTPKPTK